MIGQRHETVGAVAVEAGLGGDDLGFHRGGRIVEFDGHETLAGRGFQAFQDVLVAGVVGDDEHEAVGRGDSLAGALQRQDAAVVGQRVEHDGDVLAGLDHLVEIADAAIADRTGQRAILPHGFAALDQPAAGQIGGGEIVMAGDGGQRCCEARGHMGDETGLAAARRALDQQRKPVAVGGLEHLTFVADGAVERNAGGGLGLGDMRVHGKFPSRKEIAPPKCPFGFGRGSVFRPLA